MKTNLIIFAVSAIVFFGLQAVLPFPYGLVFGIFVPAMLIWAYYKKTNNPSSLVNLKRIDPQTKKEKEQNLEAYRKLKARYIKGEITKEEFENLKKPFAGEVEDDD